MKFKKLNELNESLNESEFPKNKSYALAFKFINKPTEDKIRDTYMGLTKSEAISIIEDILEDDQGDTIEYIALYEIKLDYEGYAVGDYRLVRRYYSRDNINENYIPNETFNGTDEEYEELSDIIFDRCKDPNTNRISLIISDIDNVDYYDLTLSIPEYTYDNYEGWEFGGELLDDLAEFLDKSINQITQQDVNTFDVDKFLEFLSDKYRDNIIEEMEDDVSFMDSAYEEEIDKLEGEASEPNWDDLY